MSRRLPRCAALLGSGALAGTALGGLALWQAWFPARFPAWLHVDGDAAAAASLVWTAWTTALLLAAGCLPATWLDRLPPRRPLPAPALWPAMAGAAAWAWSTLETVVHNDGVVGLPGYTTWGPLIHWLVPPAAALLGWLLGALWRRWPAWAGLLLGLLGTALAAFVLAGPLGSTYRDLLGHLWLGAAVLIGLAIEGFARCRPARPLRHLSAVALGLSLGMAPPVDALSVPTRLLLQRFAEPVGSWFDAVPPSAWLHRDLLPPDQRPIEPAEAAAFARELTDPARLRGGEALGRHVILLVLESTRADLWGDPAITPRFAKLRKQGTWARRAVAQYPATPLAYGAIFTSQPPSVLARSAYWARHRLFDELRPRFDAMFLSKPRNRWFSRSAITSFFLPPGANVRRHPNSSVALRALRRRIESLKKEERLFAWVHLYEPHAPYRPPPPFVPEQRSLRTRYEGELRYVDRHLGEFLEWFSTQPMARETLIVVVGDHGEGLGEHVLGARFTGHHVHVHSVVSLVPMYLQGPGVPAGRVIEEPLLQQLDVMPTLFDFLGVDLPARHLPQGDSALRLLRAPRTRPLVTEAFNVRGSTFFAFVERARRVPPDTLRERFRRIAEDFGRRYAPKVALQLGWEKLVQDRILRRAAYYDLRGDPMERSDLSSLRPRRFGRLRSHLRRWERRQRWVVEQLDRLLARPAARGKRDGGSPPSKPPAGPDASVPRPKRSVTPHHDAGPHRGQPFPSLLPGLRFERLGEPTRLRPPPRPAQVEREEP